jgi:hypothetical protein
MQVACFLERSNERRFEKYQEIEACKDNSCGTPSEEHIADTVERLVKWHTYSITHLLLLYSAFNTVNVVVIRRTFGNYTNLVN